MLDFLFVRQNPFAVKGGARNCADGTYHAGTLTVDGGELVFSGLEANVALPITGLKIRRNRWLGGAARFTHSSIPEWILLTKDLRIFNAPQAEEDFAFTHGIEHCRVYLQNLRRTLKLSLLAFILLFIFVQPAREFIVDRAVVYIPIKEEAELGEKVFLDIQARGKIINDPVVAVQLQAITERIVSGLPAEDRAFDFKFHIVCDPNINAFAIPGGHIVVNSGLILDAADVDEVAGILGHEVGHITRRHSMAQLVETIGIWGLLTILTGHGDGAAQTATGLAAKKLSRDHECCADEMAWRYTRGAEIDSRGLLRFFERLNRKEQDSNGPASDFDSLLRTHPLTRERVAALQQLGAGATPAVARPIAVDFADFKARVSRLQQAALQRQ